MDDLLEHRENDGISDVGRVVDFGSSFPVDVTFVTSACKAKHNLRKEKAPRRVLFFRVFLRYCKMEFLYSSGDILTIWRKQLEKYCGVSKPSIKAICVKLYCPSRINFFASSILR